MKARFVALFFFIIDFLTIAECGIVECWAESQNLKLRVSFVLDCAYCGLSKSKSKSEI